MLKWVVLIVLLAIVLTAGADPDPGLGWIATWPEGVPFGDGLAILPLILLTLVALVGVGLLLALLFAVLGGALLLVLCLPLLLLVAALALVFAPVLLPLLAVLLLVGLLIKGIGLATAC